jgi:hypothetical protein
MDFLKSRKIFYNLRKNGEREKITDILRLRRCWVS